VTHHEGSLRGASPDHRNRFSVALHGDRTVRRKRTAPTSPQPRTRKGEGCRNFGSRSRYLGGQHEADRAKMTRTRARNSRMSVEIARLLPPVWIGIENLCDVSAVKVTLLQADARGGTNESGAPPREFAPWVPSRGKGSLRLLGRASRTPSRLHKGARGHRLAGPGWDSGTCAQNRASL
jgi:hypothetical protein